MSKAEAVITNWLNEAVVLHRQGRIAEAERLYTQVLAASPGHPDALHLLGVVARQSGRPLQAVLNIVQAAARNPTLPALHQNLDRAIDSLGPADAVMDALGRQLLADPTQHALRLALLQVVARQAAADPEAADDSPSPRDPALGDTRHLPAISVVICSINEAKFARVTANLSTLLAGADYEIIGIHDARSLSEGYARGIASSRGDIIVLCHDDIEILNSDFEARLRHHLSNYDIIGVVGTSRMTGATWVHAGWPHQHGLVVHTVPGERPYRVEVYGVSDRVTTDIQALDGLFMAGRRTAIQAVGFDAKTFDGFHLYDMDFSIRAHRAGLKLSVCNDLWLVHQSTGRMDETWRQYAQSFLEKHRSCLPGTAEPGPNPLRGVWLSTRGQVRAFCERMLTLGERLSAASWPGRDKQM